MGKRLEKITCYMTFDGPDCLSEFNEFLAINRLNTDIVIRKETVTPARGVKTIKEPNAESPYGQLELVFRRVNKLSADELAALPVFTRRWVFDILNGKPRDAAPTVVGAYMEMQDGKGWTAAEREELNEAIQRVRIADK